MEAWVKDSAVGAFLCRPTTSSWGVWENSCYQRQQQRTGPRVVRARLGAEKVHCRWRSCNGLREEPQARPGSNARRSRFFCDRREVGDRKTGRS